MDVSTYRGAVCFRLALLCGYMGAFGCTHYHQSHHRSRMAGGCFFLWIRALTGTNFSRPNELSTSDAAAPRRTSPTASRNYGNLLLWPGPFKVLPTQDRTLFVSEKSTFCSPHTRTSTAAIVCACGMESAGANCAKSGVRTLGVAREFCWRIPIVGVGIFGGTLLSRCQAQLFMF